MSEAKAQDLYGVINPFYICHNEEERLLFFEKQKLMTGMLRRMLQTNKGKASVRKHARNSSAQKIYIELKEHHLTSTKAESEAEGILNYLITSRVDDGKWKGTTHSYILHWEKQVALYNDKSSEKLVETHQRTYLQQAVIGISELAIVKTTAKTIGKTLKKEIGYDIYIDLLRDAAQQYDLSLEKTDPKEQRRTKPNVYSHDIIDPNDDFYDANEDENNIHDVDTTLYDLNFGQSVPTRLPRDSWFGLTTLETRIS